MSQQVLPTICVVAFHFDETTQTFVRRHARELNAGNTVLVARQETDVGTYGKPLLHWPKPISKPGQKGIAGWFTRPKEDPGSFPDDFVAFLEQHQVGAVLCEFGTVGIHFSALCRQAGVPMFCYFRGYDATRGLGNRSYRNALARMFTEADGVVAVSSYLLERLGKHGLRHPNAHVIPSGVDTPAFMPGEKDPNLILAVGRMTDKKAPLTTIRAFASVAASRPGIRLEMIGDGWLLKRAQKLVQRLGMEERITLLGARDHAFVADRVKRATIFMQHSVTSWRGETEGAPTAIQEAMTAGAAIASTVHAGIPEIVTNGEHGFLVRERDLRGYTSALAALVDDPSRRERMGSAAHAHAVAHFDYRKLYQRLETAMAEAIAARGR